MDSQTINDIFPLLFSCRLVVVGFNLVDCCFLVWSKYRTCLISDVLSTKVLAWI